MQKQKFKETEMVMIPEYWEIRQVKEVEKEKSKKKPSLEIRKEIGISFWLVQRQTN